MPLYEFKCGKCGETFDDLVKVGQEKTPCPDCGEEADKVPGIHSTDFVLEGFGWALDGYSPSAKKREE